MSPGSSNLPLVEDKGYVEVDAEVPSCLDAMVNEHSLGPTWNPSRAVKQQTCDDIVNKAREGAIQADAVTVTDNGHDGDV